MRGAAKRAEKERRARERGGRDARGERSGEERVAERAPDASSTLRKAPSTRAPPTRPTRWRTILDARAQMRRQPLVVDRARRHLVPPLWAKTSLCRPPAREARGQRGARAKGPGGGKGRDGKRERMLLATLPRAAIQIEEFVARRSSMRRRMQAAICAMRTVLAPGEQGASRVCAGRGEKPVPRRAGRPPYVEEELPHHPVPTPPPLTLQLAALASVHFDHLCRPRVAV